MSGVWRKWRVEREENQEWRVDLYSRQNGKSKVYGEWRAGRGMMGSETRGSGEWGVGRMLGFVGERVEGFLVQSPQKIVAW